MRAELHDVIDADAGAVVNGYHSEGRAEAIEVVQQLSAVPGVSGRYLLQGPDGAASSRGNLAADGQRRPGLFEVRSTHVRSSAARRRARRGPLSSGWQLSIRRRGNRAARGHARSYSGLICLDHRRDGAARHRWRRTV